MRGLVATVFIVAAVALIVVLRTPVQRAPPPEGAPAPSSEGAQTAARLPPGPSEEAPPAARPTPAPKTPPAAKPVPPAKPAPDQKLGPDPKPAPSGKAAPDQKPVPKAASGATGSPAQRSLPRVAIVLDDCGQRLDLMERAARARLPLTFAVLPHLAHSSRSAEIAHAAGNEVIVHQPMQPEDKSENPGEHAILVGMKVDRVRQVLQASFRDVPHAIGLNNHMGSAATADRALMEVVVAALERVRPGALFLDSRTSPKTVAAEIARHHGMPTAERAVFLDNDLAPAAIRGELARLMTLAAEHGEVVAIGHLKAETLDVLEREIPRLDGRECQFVFLSTLVR